jgi:formylglycine-generating enzyme required for sulfatase activity
MRWLHRLSIGVIWACCVFPSAVSAAETNVGFLVPGTAGALDQEFEMAWETAERLTSAALLLPGAGGRFVDRQGRDVALDGFRAIWCYSGDPGRSKGPVFDPETVEALRQYVSRGRGLWIAGGAATLVEPLGLDTLRAQAVRAGQDYSQAGLVPLAARHPALQGFDLEQGTLWISNAAFPAFAEFRLTSQPAKGMILAESPGMPSCPLVEYEAGQGRVIVLGWRLASLYGHASAGFRRNFEQLATNLVRYLGSPETWQPLSKQADGRPLDVVTEPKIPAAQWRSLELAIRDLRETFGSRYPRGEDFWGRLDTLKRRQAELDKQHQNSPPEAAKQEVVDQFQRLKAEALLANPLLDFSRLLVVRRDAQHLGLPANYLSNSSLPPTGYDNQIAVLSPVGSGGKRATLYQPPHGEFVGDVRLDYDAQRLLFSMPNSAGRWRVFEMNVDGSAPRELPLINEPDVDNYDACYLPDERIVFSSTACFAGIPCVNGQGHVANLYSWERSGKIRQLTVEQDHDWCPTVLNNGRVLYLRWEYTDLPHAFSRILFHMNPDGTEQMEYYGSNSYWPAAMFFARAIPNHPTKVVAIVGGHHETPRMGDLVIFDPARGRQEAQGAVQRIPGFGRKVEPVVLDLPIGRNWPKFLHPYPLSDKYFLVSCKPSEKALWGIYLVDAFDNALLLDEEPGFALLEPIPLRATPRPPCLPDKVDLDRKDADVLIADIYRGQAMRGVPRGTIKSLRVIGYHFAYQGMGAEPYSVGLDGPWDPKRVLGTVPVEEDGSASFHVPAYTPIALQPLDAEGKAVQLMRSWFTAMPGEVVSCVGCHEPQNTAPPLRPTLASRRPPAEIRPWYGPARGFSFRREVQPVLDRHCARCHNGQPRADGRQVCSFVDGKNVPVRDNANRHNQEARFSPSYYQLRRFVRTPCKESDMHVLRPWEYHADTTRLVQMLQKGHYDVRLDAESRDRLITWIDLNAPFHGNWNDIRGEEIGELVRNQSQRRAQMRSRYAGADGSPEEAAPRQGEKASGPVALSSTTSGNASSAQSRGAEAAATVSRSPSAAHRAEPAEPADQAVSSLTLPLSPTVSLELVRVPAGEFVMGQEDGAPDERPTGRVKLDKPFWIGRFEVTNEQFALFDPAHDSRWENVDFIKFGPGELGWTLARPRQPVVRVSWAEAMTFCRWLSQKTGRRCTLPTEAQWEYACRAGTTTPLWYGDVDSDFSRVANVSDLSHQLIDTFDDPNRPEVIAPWRPADTRFDDHCRVSAPVGSYRANPWGLFDMHGNVAEWTRSVYRPSPYRDDGRNEGTGGKRVVRGGSWYDRPERCRAAFRQAYLADQPVYDVGFRVVCE